GTAKHIKQFAVVNHEAAAVGHEDLQAADTLLLDCRQILNRALVEVVDNRVHAVIDSGLAVRFVTMRLQRVRQVLVGQLRCEVDHGRGAAHGGSSRAGFEVVGSRGIEHGRVEVGVDVDTARKQKHTAAVDNFDIFGR